MVKGQFAGHYDILLVGAGLYNAVLAYRFQQMGLSVCVVERRTGQEIGGNCATETRDGIIIHKYGAHIFHTSDKSAWEFANKFAHFVPFINSPIAIAEFEVERDPRFGVGTTVKTDVYNLPFNMNTFAKIFGLHRPRDVAERLKEETAPYIKETYNNLEEKALSLVGPTIFHELIKGYTEKQWGRPCDKLPPDIITRIPLRMIYDNNYFNDTYQGIPAAGYSEWINAMYGNATFYSGIDYIENRAELDKLADHIFYSGRVDEFFNFKYGKLDYRSLKFETVAYDTDNYQGVAVCNYTTKLRKYTRSIEHRHFMWDEDTPSVIKPNTTYVTYEYPADMSETNEPFYSVNDTKNNELYAKYAAECPENVTFVGRLGMYRYNDMDDTIISALNMDLTKFAKKF